MVTITKQLIKSALVPITIHFFLNFGFFIAWPYNNLQARSYGLSLSDILLVAGIVPFITFPASPLIGYAGDKLGYRLIFIVVILATATMALCFCFFPSYTETAKYWVMIESLDHFNSSVGNPIKQFFSYTINQNCSSNLQATISNIVCNGTTYAINYNLNVDQSISVNQEHCERNGLDYCRYELAEHGANYTVCEAQLEGAENRLESGSKQLVFWMFVVFRTVWEYTINPAWNIADAMASRIATGLKIEFATILGFASIAGAIAPLVAGGLSDYLATDVDKFECITNQPAERLQNYNVAFIALFITYVICAIIIPFFNINFGGAKEEKISVKKDLYWLPKPAPIFLYTLQFVCGLNHAIYDGFYFVYITEKLNISVDWFGVINGLNGAFSCILIFFGGLIRKRVGSMNIILIGFLLASLRVCLVSYIGKYGEGDIPWEVLFSTMCETTVFQGVGTVAYVKIIAPLELTATAIGISSCVNFILARGIGSLIGAQLVKITTEQILLRWVGYVGMGLTIFGGILYHTLIKRTESPMAKVEKQDQQSSETGF